MKKRVFCVVFAGLCAVAALPASAWSPLGAMLCGGPGEKGSVVFPSADCTIAGLAFCGLGEWSRIYGLELGVVQYVDAMYGIQCGFYNGMTTGCGFEAGLFNFADSAHGLQVGLANIADGAGVTVQVGLYNGPSALTHGYGGSGGLQVGLVNNSYRGRHVQIGLYNNAEDAEWCFQLGLFCKHNDTGFLLLGWHW